MLATASTLATLLLLAWKKTRLLGVLAAFFLFVFAPGTALLLLLLAVPALLFCLL